MLNLDRILSQDRLLRATTGLNRKACEDLLVSFESVYLSLSQKSDDQFDIIGGIPDIVEVQGDSGF